jgi:hypothetical protein
VSVSLSTTATLLCVACLGGDLTGRASGRVTAAEDASPVPRALVRLTYWNQIVAQGTTDDGGTYDILYVLTEYCAEAQFGLEASAGGTDLDQDMQPDDRVVEPPIT